MSTSENRARMPRHPAWVRDQPPRSPVPRSLLVRGVRALSPAEAHASSVLPDVLPMSYVPPDDRLDTDESAPASPSYPKTLVMDASWDLDDREFDVLAELARQEDGRTAFQGLRRRLGLHQQALTRTLRRLERQGVVEHDAQGYALTGQGHAALRGRAPLAPRRAEVLPLLQALLPPNVTADDVAERLARRWFRDLRWYGRADGPAGTTLTWLTVDRGLMVRVRFQAGAAVLEIEVPPGERLQAFPAAQAVLRALSDLYALPEAQAGS